MGSWPRNQKPETRNQKLSGSACSLFLVSSLKEAMRRILIDHSLLLARRARRAQGDKEKGRQGERILAFVSLSPCPPVSLSRIRRLPRDALPHRHRS
jgi:hypothetical protein